MFSGNAKLLLYGPLDDSSFKVPFPAEVQGIYQLIGNDRIIPALLGSPDVTAANPVRNTFTVTAVDNKGVEYIHGILHCLNLFNGFLYLPDGCDIFFLPRQALFRRIIRTQIPRGGVQAVTHHFPKVQNIHRDAGSD